MKRWLIIVVVLGCCIVATGLATAMGKKSTDRLLFEHIGPQDAAIPSFIVEVGPVAKSMHTVIFVSPETYEAVFALVQQAANAPLRSPRPMGTFCVTSSKDGKTDKVFTIYPEAMLSVISRLRQMFQSEGYQLPELLLKIETILTPPK